MKRRSDWRESEQRVIASHRSLVAHENDAASALCLNDGRLFSIERQHFADRLAATNLTSERSFGNEETVKRGRVVNLQMGLVNIARDAGLLLAQRQLATLQDARPLQQIFQTTFKGLQITRLDTAGAPAFQVDGGNVASVRRAERTAGQKRTNPAPEMIEARSHGALGFVHRARVCEVAGPRQQFVRAAATVQVHVVGALREQRGVEQMREARCGIAIRTAREGPGEIAAVGRMAALRGEKCSFIKHWHHHHGAAQHGGFPDVDPLAQQGWSLVFVAMGGAVDQEHGTWAAAPDKGVEPNPAGLKAALVKTGGEASKINFII